MSIDFAKLAEPFHPQDIEWRVSRATRWGPGVRCWVFAYVTARGIHQRLDDVVGPENWCNTPQIVTEVKPAFDNRPSVLSIQVGISIRINDQWITKYNVSEVTGIEPAKGAYSGAEKRAGEEWGIGRYLWWLQERDAKTTVTEPPGDTHRYAKASKVSGTPAFWWLPPNLPAWALPPESGDANDRPVTIEQVNELKTMWVAKFASTEKSRAVKSERWKQLLTEMFKDFPSDDPKGWTQNMIAEVRTRIETTKDGGKGPSSDVPFE